MFSKINFSTNETWFAFLSEHVHVVVYGCSNVAKLFKNLRKKKI